MQNGTSTQHRPPAPWRRAGLLIGCVLAGGLVGAVGRYAFDSSAGFLAVPGFVLLAWLFVANPTECLPTERRGPHPGHPPR